MRKSRSIGVAFLAVAISASAVRPAAAAHRSDDGDRPYWRTNLFKRVATDQKFLVMEWWPQEIKDPLFASTLAAGVALAIQSGGRETGGRDLQWETGIAGSAGPDVQRYSHTFTRLGNGAPIAAMLGIAYLSARRAHNERMSEATSLAAESLLDAGIWIEFLKLATARVRPNEPDAGRFFQYGRSSNGSFPSGHAMGAFAVASVFAESYHDKKWVPWFSYGLATLIGGSRLALGRHFPGDVIVGAVLGASIGRGVVARSRGESPPSRGELVPVLGPDGRGAGIGWRHTWR